MAGLLNFLDILAILLIGFKDIILRIFYLPDLSGFFGEVMCQDSIHRGLRKLIPGKDFVSGEIGVTFWTVTIPQARQASL